MKLKDIINTIGNRIDWLNFDFGWRIADNGDICPTLPIDINLDSEVDVIYYHYHHMMPSLTREEIWKAIEEHDYETFSKWCDKLSAEPIVYLPSAASIFSGEHHIGELCIAYDPNVFSLITFQDCECG